MCLLSFSAACAQCNLSSLDTSVWKLEKKLIARKNKAALRLWFNQLPLSSSAALPPAPGPVVFNFLCQLPRPRSALAMRRWRLAPARGPYQALPVSAGPAQLSGTPSVPCVICRRRPRPGEEGARGRPRPPRSPPAGQGSAAGHPAPTEPPPASPNRLKRGRNKTANLD